METSQRPRESLKIAESRAERGRARSIAALALALPGPPSGRLDRCLRKLPLLPRTIYIYILYILLNK